MMITTIDPSYRNFAMARIEVLGRYDYKVIDFRRPEFDLALKKKSSLGVIEQRLKGAEYLSHFLEHINDSWYDTTHIIAELPGGSQSARAAICTGVVLGVLSSTQDKINFVRPMDVKKAVTKQMKLEGIKLKTKHPTKHDIIKWARGKHPEAPWTNAIKYDEHYADAIAVCYAWEDLGRYLPMISVGGRK